MPFIRFTRDKRGNETTVVMHAYRGMPGAQHGRVLYLFHTPSHVKLGREPLDAEVREALEHTHPDLAFDWPVLLRDSSASRVEARDRPVRPAGRPPFRPAPSRSTPAPRPAPAPPPPPVLVDESALGRTLGAETALRLRRSYGDLVERVGRRARTPEERDRLIERAMRLNPDEWPDEASIRAGAASFDAGLAELAAAVPSRRRGRRGGRRPTGAEAPGAASAIIEETEETGDDHASSTQSRVVDADRMSDDGGHDRTGGGSDATDPADAAAGPAADLPSHD